jgi:hypothetical protein
MLLFNERQKFMFLSCPLPQISFTIKHSIIKVVQFLFFNESNAFSVIRHCVI